MKWLKLFVVLPLIGLLVITNIYEDPATIFHDESKGMAEAVVDGQKVYSVTGNLNEREFKRNLIMLMPDETDTIAVGPSLMMCINKNIVGTEDYINLGVSASNIYDILAQFGLMDIYGKKFKRVILCLDPYSFDESLFDANREKNASLMPYSEYMIKKINGENPSPVDIDNNKDVKVEIEQAFSVSYFQSSWNQVVLNGTYLMDDNRRWGIVTEGFDGSKPFYDPDGSITFDSGLQSNDVNDVVEQCSSYNIDYQFGRDRHISEYGKDIYEKLIKYLTDQGIEVELFLCPLAPSLWDRIDAEKEHFAILYEVTDFAEAVSGTYDLKITGSYNPYELGIKDEDFYDPRHVRREVMGDFFDFCSKD
ncbi:hypothetical protein SAMN02910369_01300 [Lachnospiraceae bacterium NE2001]|nr:hypothetical protein SAMN02910369_01300 [Lachnospiraceae bacterium NE2001]